MSQKGFTPLIIILIFAVVLIGGYLIYQKQNTPVVPAEIPFVTTFEECVKSSGSKVIESYPRQCESSEGKTYVEEIKEPIDTSKWQTVNTNFDFSFKCPPRWSCSVPDAIRGAYEYVARASTNNYVRYSVGFGVVKAVDFQKGPFRHPNYKNGVEWFKDLQAKNPQSVKLMPGTYGPGRPGTDSITIDPPIYYYGFKLDQMQETEIDNKKALIVKGFLPKEIVILPLNDQDLLYIGSDIGNRGEQVNTNNVTTSLEKAIISSIKFTSSAVSQ